MAKKEITVQFKLQAPGGTATPAPPIGPALGQHGVNPGQFIQQFNAATRRTSRARSSACWSRSTRTARSTFELKSPPASVLLKDAVKAEKGTGEPNKNKIGKVTMAQCKEIAKEKVKDLNAFDEDARRQHHRGHGAVDGDHGRRISDIANHESRQAVHAEHRQNHKAAPRAVTVGASAGSCSARQRSDMAMASRRTTFQALQGSRREGASTTPRRRRPGGRRRQGVHADQVRPVGRADLLARHRPQAGRPDDPRVAVAAARHRQGQARHRVLPRAPGRRPPWPPARSRPAGRSWSQEIEKDELHRLRRRHRHAGHDAVRRPPR